MKAIQNIRLSKQERAALNREINCQIGENVQKLSESLTAMILWQLHEQLGFGKKRLMRFYKKFLPALEQLRDYYCMETDEETEFLCQYQLKHIVGIDVSQLDDLIQFRTAVK